MKANFDNLLHPSASMESMMSNRHDLYDVVTTDIQRFQKEQRQAEGMAEKAIEAMGDLLNNADGFLQELESSTILGTAIVRRCQELADVIGSLANELEKKSMEEQRAMAQACLEDCQTSPSSLSDDEQAQLANLSENDIMNALSAAHALLRDIEESLRSIDRNEAEEIADVALIMARLFFMSLQNLHSTITPDDLLLATSTTLNNNLSGRFTVDEKEFSSRIEMLNEIREDDGDATTPPQPRSIPTKRKRVDNRVRALWPPLGPAVVSAAQWGKDAATKKPLLAIALGLTLWPAAILTAMVGTPVVIADGLVQHIYNSMSDGPIVQTIERGAAQVYAAGRLSFLSSRLVVRQTLRVASRQVERHGGVEKIAHELGGLVLDRATHPIETICMAWDGLCMGAGAVKDGIHFVKDAVERHQGEADQIEIIRQ